MICAVGKGTELDFKYLVVYIRYIYSTRIVRKDILVSFFTITVLILHPFFVYFFPQITEPVSG